MSSGAKVHVCDVNESALEQCQNSLPEIGISLADVGSLEQIDTMFDTALAQMGGIDVLVNNAGISGPAGAIESLDVAGWKQTLDVNLTSMFYTCRRAIPLMKAQRSGSIINISSTAGLFGYPNRTPYAASKWAVVGLTKSLAMELGEFGIRVNVICPGSINNPRMDNVIAIESAATGVSQQKIRYGYEKQVSLQTFIDSARDCQHGTVYQLAIGQEHIGAGVMC